MHRYIALTWTGFWISLSPLEIPLAFHVSPILSVPFPFLGLPNMKLWSVRSLCVPFPSQVFPYPFPCNLVFHLFPEMSSNGLLRCKGSENDLRRHRSERQCRRDEAAPALRARSLAGSPLRAGAVLPAPQQRWRPHRMSQLEVRQGRRQGPSRWSRGGAGPVAPCAPW